MNPFDIPRFLAALAVGAIHELGLAAAVRAAVVFHAARHWAGLNRQPELRRLQQERLARCRACPVFFAPLRTCGSPLQRRPLRLPNGRRAGCLCFMPVKAAHPEAVCWAAEEWDYLPENIKQQTAPFKW